jgi:hypothetical protein
MTTIAGIGTCGSVAVDQFVTHRGQGMLPEGAVLEKETAR